MIMAIAIAEIYFKMAIPIKFPLMLLENFIKIKEEFNWILQIWGP